MYIYITICSTADMARWSWCCIYRWLHCCNLRTTCTFI